jgi:hypothetical protein
MAVAQAGGRVGWRRQRAWIEVFSSAEMTNSSGPSRSPGKPVLVQVEHDPRLGGEVRGTGKDPRTVPPRLEGVLVRPAPDGTDTQLLHQPAGDSLLAHVSNAEAAQRDRPQRGQLTGDRRDLSDDRRGEGPRPARPVPVSQARQALLEEALAPLQRGVRRDAQALGDLLVLLTLRGCKHDPSPQHLPLLGRASAQRYLQHPALVRGEHDLKRAAPTHRTSKIRLARGQIRRRLYAGTYKAKY